MIERKYKCNLCRDEIQNGPCGFEGQGIYWGGHPQGWQFKPWRECEHHLCYRCIASIQGEKKYCVGGFACNGGLACTSDHK